MNLLSSPVAARNNPKANNLQNERYVFFFFCCHPEIQILSHSVFTLSLLD